MIGDVMSCRNVPTF